SAFSSPLRSNGRFNSALTRPSLADFLLCWLFAATGLAVDVGSVAAAAESVVVLALAAGLSASPSGAVADFEEEAARAAAVIIGFVCVIGCLPFSRKDPAFCSFNWLCAKRAVSAVSVRLACGYLTAH